MEEEYISNNMSDKGLILKKKTHTVYQKQTT